MNITAIDPADHPDWLDESRYVSRGGVKLAAALIDQSIDVTALACADLGCSTGGFTDCLLQRGAASVVSIDTAYGELAWKLRQDPRVTVRERTNALHAEPGDDGPVDLVAVDLSWTVQWLAVPAALKWLKPDGMILSLVKPHYEAKEFDLGERVVKGVMAEPDAERVLERVLERLPELGVAVEGVTKSPISGGKKKASGNTEWVVALKAGEA